MKTTLVRTAAALALTCGAAVAGAAAASAQDVPYPPVQTDPGVDSTVQVQGVVVTRSSSDVTVGSVVDPAATSGLASTGADVLPYAAGGGVLLVVGAGLVLTARRRQA